jgi:phosphate transport system permease protein
MANSKNHSDQAFKALMALFAFSIVGLTILFFYELTKGSFPIIREGLAFLYLSKWSGDAGNVFGVLPMLYGSVVTSAIALLIGVPVSLGVAVFLSELSPSSLRPPVGFLVEMLAAIPSVVYGLWGLFILAPLLRDSVYPTLFRYLGFLPILGCPTHGTPCQFYMQSILTAGVVLAIMIIPIVSSVSRDALLAVPDSQREAAYALGATKSEAIRMSVLSYARSGIFASIFLGLGRAFGETIAVTMVVGNSPSITGSLFSPGYTLASLIANEFTEATTAVHISALIEAGLVLLVVVFFTNIMARLLISRFVRSRGAATYL